MLVTPLPAREGGREEDIELAITGSPWRQTIPRAKNRGHSERVGIL